MPRPAGTRFASVLATLALFLLLSACSNSQDSQNANAGDSTALAMGDSASAAPDSLAEEEQGGFFARFRRGDSEDEEEVEAIPVELVEVTRRDVPSYLSATASLEAEKQVEIHCKAAGQLQKLLVEEGDYVREGQALCRLDGAVQRVAVEEAGLRAQSAERVFRRSEAMYKVQDISEQEFQEVKFRYDEALAQQQAAEIALEHCSVLAPFSGIIAERFVDLGQNLILGSRIFSIVDADPLLARIFLPEKEAVHIAPGQDVVISPSTHPDLELSGEVLRISPIVDTRTGTVKVTCQIPGDSELRPGSFVRVLVQTDLHPDVLVIPKRALVPEGGENYVFKAVADSVIKIGIETGYSNGRYTEVVEGLELGDKVVTVGTGSLKMGTKIQALNSFLGEDDVAMADSMSEGAK
jgi:membrane fusion protein, multidrug efflux system